MPDDDDIDVVEGVSTVQSAVTVAIGRMLIMLNEGEFKMTIGEFTRLVEFDKELSDGEVNHVKVTWVNPFDATEHVSET